MEEKVVHAQANTKGTQGLGNNEAKPERISYRSRKFAAVVNNYTEEEEKKWKEYALKHSTKCIIAREIAPTTGTPHLQIYIEFKHPQTNFRIEQVIERGHWYKAAKGTAEQNDTYCDKEGNVWRHGMEEVKSLKDKLKEKCLKKYENVIWKDWQKSLLSKIEEKADSRTINWIVDLNGNSGKSFLTKYLALTKEVVIADGKKDNIFNQVNRKLNEEELEFELVILDIPRSSEGYVNYGVLEQLKNGLIYSGKYEGGMCIFDDVHVIVFANFHPDLTQFSKDRWNIVEL